MTCRTPSRAAVGRIIATLVMAAVSLAATPLTPPTEAVPMDGCFRDDCHASIRSAQVLHGPVATRACDACHELTDAQAHTYKLTREKAELCTYCHEFTAAEMPVVHKPVSEGECLGCHDPHGGNTREFIREASVGDLCARCHEPVTRGMSVLHTPVKEGACTSCHPPHAARFKKLVDVTGPDLCMACHDSFEATLSRAKFTHKALEEGCTKCHNAHGSNYAMATTQPVADQCSGCHAETRNQAMAARYPHSPVLADRACVTCHTPHGSSLDKLVVDSPATVCMSCHETEQKTPSGKTIPAVAELKNPDAHRHGGIKDGSCAGCHDAHGGDRQLHLSKNYSRLFYQRYSAANYGLCFSCHKSELVEQTQTTTATGFRNGEQNLHALHVRDTDHRGQNCRVCHSTHAGPNDKIVREGTTYGAWKMPVRFKQAGAGGTCFPGCHPLYAYDRNSPVKNTAGTATPAALIPIGRQGISAVELEATTLAGDRVTIPAGDDRPTLIALVNAANTASLDATARALPADADARVIVLLSGATGAAEAPAARFAADRNWPVIPDPDSALAAELDASAVPMLIVLRGDGMEVARIAGNAESLALKLPVYLDAAAGRADPAMTTQPVVNALVGDPVSVRQAREIERLIASGKADHALKRLLSMPEDVIPNYRHNLLGARALLAMNRLPEAKNAAEAALKQKPGFRDAHLLLGRIHEQSGDWPAAAAAYRAAATAR